MQKLKKMVAYADTHFEKPFLILGLVAMILIICYQTLYLDIVSCHSSCDQRAQQYTRRYHL